MHFTPEKILNFAFQARLETTPDRAAIWSAQLNDILNDLDRLRAVDTTHVEPMSTPLEQPCVLRPDQERKECTREQALGHAPQTQDGYFIVPRMI